MIILFKNQISELQYCLIWATIGHLAYKKESFLLQLNQNFVKFLPPLKFREFTTDRKDENSMCVPSCFALDLSINPISSTDMITELF